MKNIGVFGLGAIGSLVVSKLNPQHNLFYFNRSHKENIRVKYNGNLFSTLITINSNQRPVLDWLIICLKEHQYADALPDLRLLFSENTKIVVLRNGLYHRKSVDPHEKKMSVLPCLVDCSVNKVERSLYQQLSKAIFFLPENILGKKFSELFIENSCEFIFTENFLLESWKKLILSSVVGGIMILYEKPAEIFTNIEILKQTKQLLNELITIAYYENVSLPDEFYIETIKKIIEYPEDKSSSMLTDMQSNKFIELNAKNGVFQSIALSHNLQTPINDLICKKIVQFNAQL